MEQGLVMIISRKLKMLFAFNSGKLWIFLWDAIEWNLMEIMQEWNNSDIEFNLINFFGIILKTD